MIPATKEEENVVREWLSCRNNPGQRVRENSFKESLCELSTKHDEELGRKRREEERDLIPHRTVQRSYGGK